jgi:phospholipase C
VGHRGYSLAIGLAFAMMLAALAWSAVGSGSAGRATAARAGIHKIRHVVIIMQENRSFDSYFGTYPGADGIPGLAGNPGKVPCSPDPMTHACVKPYHDTKNRNAGGPHGTASAIRDIAHGSMSGFQAAARNGRSSVCKKNIQTPNCSLTPSKPDVMGYHDSREIPNYWSAALRPPGSHVRVGERVEPAGAPVSRLGLVRALRQAG